MNRLALYLNAQEFEEIKNIPDLYSRCLRLVEILFKNRVDKQGLPYIRHLVRVASKMSTYEGKVLGLLHDTIEDISYIEYEDLQDIGVPPSVIEALKLVTKEDVSQGSSDIVRLKGYHEMISRIVDSGNPLAIELKFNDMMDNFNPKRLQSLPKEEQDWLYQKYGGEIERLHYAYQKVKK